MPVSDEFLAYVLDQLAPFPGKPARMPYGEVPPSALENSEELVRWAARSLKARNKSKQKR